MTDTPDDTCADRCLVCGGELTEKKLKRFCAVCGMLCETCCDGGKA